MYKSTALKTSSSVCYSFLLSQSKQLNYILLRLRVIVWGCQDQGRGSWCSCTELWRKVSRIITGWATQKMVFKDSFPQQRLKWSFPSSLHQGKYSSFLFINTSIIDYVKDTTFRIWLIKLVVATTSVVRCTRWISRCWETWIFWRIIQTTIRGGLRQSGKWTPKQMVRQLLIIL